MVLLEHLERHLSKKQLEIQTSICAKMCFVCDVFPPIKSEKTVCAVLSFFTFVFTKIKSIWF